VRIVLLDIAAKHEGAAADFAAHQSAFARQRIGTPHGTDCHPNVECEVALRWQLGAGEQRTAGNVGFYAVRELQVQRAGAM
jgi:hypothetical protein